jgi:hypothetical protein
LIEGPTNSLTEALMRFIRMAPDERKSMGQAAAQAVAGYDEKAFVEGWRAIYRATSISGRNSSALADVRNQGSLGKAD